MGNKQNKLLGMADSGTEIMRDGLYGDHETQVSEGGEADLHKHRIGCKKNPGHIKFIPVYTFTINHLPEGHRDNDLYEYIKATADLTVRVDVKMTSPHRPEFWPDTNVSYPFYNMRDKTYLRTRSGMMIGVKMFTDGYSGDIFGGKHKKNYTKCWCEHCQHWQNTKVSYPFYNMRDKTNWRTGSGIVSGVNKFTDGYRDDGDEHCKNYTTCWCKQCQHLDTASHVWWEFDMYTATHVVFDDIEASHTSLRLFYDREGSPVVSVDQVSVDDVNIESDMCMLKCVTCDKNLGDKLDMLWRHYRDVWMKVRDKYRESRDVDKLSFIVSHPHGCCKQVSVGHWLNKYNVDKYNNTFTYTTCTCPGSSGAKVHCVGYNGVGGWWMYQLVHSGSVNNLNYSGAGSVW